MSAAAGLPSVSVVVCAYTMRRWDQVAAALRGAAEQDVPATELILLVDHNDELLARARAELVPALPGLRVIPSSRTKGLSGARNTALLAAGGEVVVFLDDDARPDGPGWLGALLAPFADPSVLGVGGTAEPLWPAGARRPVTLPPGQAGRGVLDWVVGCSFDGQPVTRRPIRNLMGCNMSVRREQALTAGGFAESLGRVGRTPLGCEETELCIRLGARHPGTSMIFEPAAHVRHQVSEDRLTWAYLRSRSYAEGISKAAVSGMVGQDSALSSERSYVARVLPGALARGLAGVARPDGASRLTHAAHALAVVTCLTWTVAGYVRGRAGLRGGVATDRPALADADRQPTGTT